jgi:serine protease Do
MYGFSKRLSWQLLTSVLVVMMLTIVVVAPHARAASTDSTAHGVRLASPAVVRILTTIDGQVICNSCAIDGSTITFPSNDSSYELFASGSGALISPDGYVLTADHVVDFQPNDPYIQEWFFQSLIQDYAMTHGISEDQATQLFKQLQDQLSYSYKVTRQQVFLSTAYTGLLQSVAQVTSYEVTRIVVNSSPDRQDVAIIKVEAQDLPYLALASASSIHVQDSVTAITFPADAETSSFVALADPNSTRSTSGMLSALLTPSVETGQITAEKPLSDGTQVYETSNIAAAGSSGGPVVNSHGQIIGFVDAASLDQRVVILVPSEIVASYTRQAGIANLQAGSFMSLWTKAINEYDASWACHWTQAYQDLKQLREKYSQFGGVQPFLKEAQARATPSECPPPPPLPTGNWLTNNLPLLAGLGAGVILVGIGLLFFAFRHRKKDTPQAEATMTSTSAGRIPEGMPMQDSIADWSEQAGGMASSIQVSPIPSEPAPVLRKCISGHVVTIEIARFCPECGAPIEESIESKSLR